MEIDFDLNDVSLPDTRVGAYLDKRQSWSIQDSRLYVECVKLRKTPKKMFTVSSQRRMEVPLVEASVGDVYVQPGRCATNVFINPSNQVIFGTSVLSKSDIVFN